MDQRLLKNSENIQEGKITLFCCPFAGGGASVYSSWIKKMEREITVCPIQLPGREDRIMEKPYNNMKNMLDDVEDVLIKHIKGPYALWGHSMGGKIAYELEKRIELRGKTAKYFFVSGSRIPSIPEPNPIYYFSDEKFKKAIGRFEGTPKEVLENQELLDFFLPMLRADFKMDETYYDKEVTTLRSPIAAFGGSSDREADVEAIKEWSQYTEHSFIYRVFKGGHFYMREQENLVISEIISLLRR